MWPHSPAPGGLDLGFSMESPGMLMPRPISAVQKYLV